MNIIHQLFDLQFITKLFEERVLPRYKDFTSIKDIEIHTYKDYIWEETYHVVIEFRTSFITRDGKIKKLPI